ncbi:hypothetical protein N7492_008978 [Penicillium capsulatum]|uniref:ATPase inhibitor, mitochondrial n=1 Tax=Penicillium capsulatum TaxID=69766 RepID=A0A9W9LHT5_9EURO|nr:hypothetical protein N7492_008978 [Penicillium capsulatum]KAJ6106379.1 hypothetical protein N7512_009896 [Penicillium capsulatum]
MLRQVIIRPTVTGNRAMLQRSFSAIAPRMGEGDTGAPRSGAGGSGGDTFTKREAAQESMYIRDQELKKLETLKKKIKDQRAHLDELEGHIENLTKDQSK